jgi:uncharacterized protein (DUF302 family)
MSNPSTPPSANATMELVAPADVHEAVAAIGGAAQAAGMTVFASVDHGAGARAAGLELGDEVLLLLGSAKVGTAVMQAAPRAGLDLPLHVLVWDDHGTTRITWRDPHALAAAHGIEGVEAVLDKMAAALRGVIDAAVA